jgi:DNA polymerase III subunit delta
VNASEALSRLNKGEALLPVYVVAGHEHVLRDAFLKRARELALAGGLADFNEDKFTAGDTSIDRIVAAARTLPMMSPRRWVMVRALDRWDTGETASAAYEALATYVETPVESTCLVLLSDKLDGRRKLAALAKKRGFLIECSPLEGPALIAFVKAEAAARGASLDSNVAEQIAALVGPDLAPIQDAVERLSLYVGPRGTIDERAVAACVTRIRLDDTWSLVDKIGKRDVRGALTTLADVYDPKDRGLPLIGALAWSFRQLLKLKLGEARGLRTDEAAKQAGIFQPGRARELSSRARTLGESELERWLSVLAETDQELKRSRRPAINTLESAILKLVRR